MAVLRPASSSFVAKYYSLAPLRILRGLVLRLFSISYSRKATSFFFGAWLALWPFLFEKINKTKVVFSGDIVPSRERILLIANHRTEVDWMYLWDFALRKGCLGYIKYVLKSSLMRLPIFGWAFHILEFIPVERKWEADESTMRHMLSTFKNPQDPLWLALFPEGTDFTEQKCLRSQKYAAEQGLPILKNVLLPKTKGFCTCLQELRDSLSAVYDVTIGYKYHCPSFLDNVFGVDPSEVHIHICRLPLDCIPESEEEISMWLMHRFQLKDWLLSNFQSQGQFPNQATERDLSAVKCILNCMTIIMLTGTCMYYSFSSVWFKLYVSLVCAYLVPATYFNIRPLPILGLLNMRSNCLISNT
ncbi:probable 1-acyl-sn-glycerol-3-phosphate acyltransferase 5 isoform X2 [Abrus precatorius]|uniref:1-acylglycerol-3-phosphate O-acyltransferase n=1 Tax=Abrus precatorius TaxID=3816 RepID=A0A8B8LI39_ABRPR|nr:probable 1-acyl-sn-glycerol-3-phosphate acyltransferase 5 isoform X2 [Abrus precatorius]